MLKLTQLVGALVCTISLLHAAQAADPFCTKGTRHPDGIACCSPACPAGKCGATDCSKYGASLCCSSAIRLANKSCDVYDASCVRSAKPVVTTSAPTTAPVSNPTAPTTGVADPRCYLGIPHPASGNLACCDKSCGSYCGASNCSVGGASKCCGSAINTSGRSCDTNSAPCMRSSFNAPVDTVTTPAPTPVATTKAPTTTTPTTGAADPRCYLGIPHPASGNLACCDKSCGSYCGASNCSVGGESKCCSYAIKTSGLSCDTTSAPCMRSSFNAPITNTTPAPTPVATTQAPVVSTPVITPAPSPATTTQAPVVTTPVNDYTAATANTLLLTCSKPGMVALTFDDGPAGFNQKLRDVLAAKGVKATFYINGNNYKNLGNAEAQADIRGLYAAGHQIASHTWGHLDLSTVSADVRKEQMCKLDVTLQKLIGVAPRHMRPPYGSCDAACMQSLTSWGYLPTNWNLDSRDWEKTNAADSFKYYTDVLPTANPATDSFVALNHEAVAFTVDKLTADVIDYVRNLPGNWKFVTMAECLDEPAYRPSPWNTGKAAYGTCSCTTAGVCA